MLTLLSPTKTMINGGLSPLKSSEPEFKQEIAYLVNILRDKSVTELEEELGLSEGLAQIALEEYSNWNNSEANSICFYAYAGALYLTLGARTLSENSLKWVSERFITLSALYGALRPLDLIKPYRLEIINRPVNQQGVPMNLFDYWRPKVTEFIDSLVQLNGFNFVLGLADDTYMKMVNPTGISVPIIGVKFQEFRNGHYATPWENARYFRGYLAKFIIENKISSIEELKKFNINNFKFVPELSDNTLLLFRNN